MHIYFQSGEFLSDGGSSWLDLFVQFLGIVVGAGISILVFQLGKKHENDKESQRLKDLELYLDSTVTNLSEPLKKQIESLKGFSMELAEKRDKDYAPQTIVSLHAKGVRWISHEDLYKIYVVGKGRDIEGNSDSLRLFNSDLDYIDSVSKSLDEIMTLFMTKKEKYTDDYNLSMKKISEMKDRIYLEYNHIVQNQNRDFKYPFFQELDKRMADWAKMENYMEHDIAHEKFLVPLQKLCRDTQPDHNAFLILGLSNDCIYALNNLAALKSFIKDGIDFKVEKLQKVEGNMIAFREKFKEKRK